MLSKSFITLLNTSLVLRSSDDLLISSSWKVAAELTNSSKIVSLVLASTAPLYSMKSSLLDLGAGFAIAKDKIDC